MEPAGSGVGSTEARSTAAGRCTLGARFGRLGSACRGSGAATDCGPLMGRAGLGRMGCAEDRGARSSRGAVMVCARCGARRSAGRTGRSSAALERASSDSSIVSAGGRARRKCSTA